MKLLLFEDSRVLSAAMMQHGKLIACTEHDDLYPQYSITKSLVSLAVGLLIAEGRLSLTSAVGELLPVPAEAALSEVTLAQLMTMRSGLNAALLFADRRTCPDYLAACLAQPVGEHRFFYNNADAYLAGRMAEAAAGIPLQTLIAQRILRVQGITEYVFEYDPQGHFFGASGLELCTRDLARLGQSVLEAKLFPADYLHEATRPQTDADAQRGYGYFFWTEPDCFYMSGKWGQRCMLFPEYDAVIAVNADMRENNSIGQFVREALLPLVKG